MAGSRAEQNVARRSMQRAEQDLQPHPPPTHHPPPHRCRARPSPPAASAHAWRRGRHPAGPRRPRRPRPWGGLRGGGRGGSPAGSALSWRPAQRGAARQPCPTNLPLLRGCLLRSCRPSFLTHHVGLNLGAGHLGARRGGDNSAARWASSRGWAGVDKSAVTEAPMLSGARESTVCRGEDGPRRQALGPRRGGLPRSYAPCWDIRGAPAPSPPPSSSMASDKLTPVQGGTTRATIVDR